MKRLAVLFAAGLLLAGCSTIEIGESGGQVTVKAEAPAYTDKKAFVTETLEIIEMVCSSPQKFRAEEIETALKLVKVVIGLIPTHVYAWSGKCTTPSG